jgi:putative CocE/NonD family hydrolase
MRDGVRLAVDVHLPDHRAGERLPTILRQTRYYRGIAFNEPFRRLPIQWLIDHAALTRDRFVANGFAWVDVCVRGSGASFGQRPCPWSPEETADGKDLVDWIVRQPWSDGKVGATGVSYDGTTAEMLLVNRHPNVLAAAPRFSLYDTFADVAFPGGIHLAWFTELWSRFNRALDAGELDAAFATMIGLQLDALAGWLDEGLVSRALRRIAASPDARGRRALMRIIAQGVRPVDNSLNEAIADHRDNFDVHAGASAIDCRDDQVNFGGIDGATIDLFSPHTYGRELQASGVPILSFSGWLDGAYQHSAIKRFRTVRTPGSQLIVGPWDHGGMHNVSPHERSHKAGFDQDGALVRFFAHHLRGDDNGVSDDPPVRYFSVGDERWKGTTTWPPPEVIPARWYFVDRGLEREPPNSTVGVDAYRIDPEVGTGRRSRWASLLGMIIPLGYGERAEAGRRMLVYRSPPLSDALNVAGHPVVELHMSAEKDDAHVFVYLEDESADGRVEYVTEGQLRALHRHVSDHAATYDSVAPFRTCERKDARPLVSGQIEVLRFDLLPIAWRFAKGHRIRLAIAGTDRDHFKAPPHLQTLAFHRSSAHPSFIELPVVGSL